MPLSRKISLVALGLTLGLSAQASFAQGAAVAEARARLVCGSGTVVSATYIPGGLLQATCRQNAPNASNAANASSNGGLGTGGLGGGTIGVGVLAAGVVLTVGSSSSSTETTATEPSVIAE